MYIYLSKNRVVHQLEEIFLKGVFSHLSLSGVEIAVGQIYIAVGWLYIAVGWLYDLMSDKCITIDLYQY